MEKNRFSGFMLVLVVVILFFTACSPAPAAFEPVIPTATAPPVKVSPTNTLAPTQPPSTPLIIDSDMSVDGIMAILYMLQRPDFSVKAITVTGDGEVHCGPGTEHALGLVAIAGQSGIPVACGRETPLVGNHAFPAVFRSMVDSSMRINWPKIGAASPLKAAELIQQTIQQAAQPVVIVTDGPLTNLAEAFQANPQLVKNIQMIYIMGGAVDVPGNLYGVDLSVPNTTAEFNIWGDPHAANLVFQSGAPITLVPLDVTNQVPLDKVFCKLLSDHQGTPAAQAVYSMLDYVGSCNESGMYLWDPLTYAIASDNSLATYVTQKLVVIEDEGAESGRTKASDAGKEIRIAMTTSYERFIETYLSTLNGGQKIAIDWTVLATPVPPDTVLTVTISGGQCTLDGPLQVPAGDFGIRLINKDLQKSTGLVVATLNPGKSLADLEAWPSVEQPPWLQVLDFLDAGQGKDTLRVFAVIDKPIYLVCFDSPPDAKIGQLGPIELKE